MSTEAAIQKGKGLVANPEFILSFALAIFLGIAGTTSIIASCLDFNAEGAFTGVRIFAVLLMVGLAVMMGVAFAVRNTSIGGDGLFVGLVALFGVVAGMVSVLALFLLWGSPPQNGWMGVAGFGQPAIAVLIALILIGLSPIVVLVDEYAPIILPILLALVGGVLGVMSVITFVMVVFIGVE